MTKPALTVEELTRYGIRLEDEGIHPFDPHVEWWNESWFWDWSDAAGETRATAGFGLLPAQKRAWVWFFLYDRGEWVTIEQPRLPLGDVQLPRLAYSGWGLDFAYDAREALLRGHLRLTGFGRVVSGPRAGMVLPVGADLEITAAGVPHTTGRGSFAGHSSEEFDACRFEQPTTVAGKVTIGDATHAFSGHGERDHSWGPRPWTMEWTFLAVGNPQGRLQCVEVRFPGGAKLGVGYFQRDATVALSEVAYDLTYDDADVLRPCRGRVQVRAEDGTAFAGTVEPISAAEIDLTHVLVPPARSIYRRALVRVTPDGGGAPLVGWCEFHYFLPRT